MTDSEIVKALECCISNKTCEEAKCPLYENGCEIDIQIPHRLALDLINRLQAENETLRGVVKQNHLIRNNGKSPLFLIKAEAYKECIEKVRKLAVGMHPCSDELRIFDSDLNNLLKELVNEQPPLNDVKCKNCEYLEFELPYAVCSKAYKGIVAPDDSCGKGKLKEMVGEDNASKD